MKTYDVVIIGTGQATGTILPQLLKEGKRVAVVEEDRVGGSCVNWGCTPTKTLVASARAAYMVQRAQEFGIGTAPAKTDFSRVMERVNNIRDKGSKGFRAWLEDVTDFYPAHGSFVDAHTVRVSKGDEQDTQIRGETIIIHTGAKARTPRFHGIDSVPWLDNKGILALKELPEHLLVVGGSYIGLEFGQALRRLGSEVTVFEHGERIIFREDPEVSAEAQKILEDEGLQFNLDVDIEGIEKKGSNVVLIYREKGKEKRAEGTHILFAIGREPATAELNLEAAGVETDDRGYVVTDDYGRTTAQHIYALGDVNGKGAFTHTSVHDGQVFLDHYLGGGGRKISHRTPIYAMYIDPPLARVGLNASQAARKGIPHKVGTMPMSAVSRAKEKSETNGMMQVITEPETKKILGATIFGVGGDEIIGMLALAMQAGLPYTQIQQTVIPHPTVSELVPWLFNDLKDPE